MYLVLLEIDFIALLKLSKTLTFSLFRNLNLMCHFQKINSKQMVISVLDVIITNMVVA